MYKPRPASGVAPLSLFTAGVAGGAAGGRPLVEAGQLMAGGWPTFRGYQHIYLCLYVYICILYRYRCRNIYIYRYIHLSTCK